MKKLLICLFLFVGCCCKVFAAEQCNTYYKININIAGNGILKVKDSDKSFTKDAVVNVKCEDDFLFSVVPDEGFKIQGVYSNGNYLSKDEKFYNLSKVSSNMNLKVVFSKDEKDLENEMVYHSNEDNISLYLDDIKEDLNDEKVLKFYLKEVIVIFDNEFIKNSNDSITLVANEIYKNDLNSKEQKAVKNALYYDINLYSGEDLVSDLKGTATIVIPYSKIGKVYVYRVEKNGKLTAVKSDYKEGKVSFKVNELGKFALSKEELNELNYVRTILNLNNKQKIAIISIGCALALLIVFVKIKKRR